MEIRMLGGIGASRVDGTVEPVQAPRPRLILAMLAARTGRPVLEDQLIEGIWGHEAPTSARTALQTYLSALRDLLEHDRPRRSPGRFIATDGGGYVLNPTAAELDLVRFEQEVSAGIRQSSDDPTAAVRLLDSALGRWGEPFAELASEPWAAGVVARLRERHSNALEARFGLALELGQEELVVEDLREAVDLYPYRERLAGQLMLTLYRLGDQVGALGVARSVRRRLLDELGLDPSPELTELETGILHHDSALHESDPASPEPGHRPRSAERSIAPILARDDAIASAGEAVRTHRVVSLVGPGGVGKSSVAAHVEARLDEEFDTGHVVDVAELPATLATDVIRSIAVSMGVTEHTLAALDQTVCDAIGSTPTLLVLETAEAAPSAVADVVQRLSAAPGLHILVTSQVPIRSTGEHVVRIAPLEPAGAMALLTGAHHQTVQHDGATLQKICEQLDYIPLALELAATQLQTLGADETLRQLERGVVTETERAGRPDRQRSSMRAAAWGIERTPPDERQLLERLAAHTVPFTLRTVRHAWGESTPDDSERALLGLIDRSLVQRVDDGSEFARFRLLDTVRSSVRSAATDMAPHSARLTDVVLETAQAALFATDSVLSLDELIGELVPALDRLHAENDARELVLAGCLALFWVSRSRVTEGAELLDRALATHRNVPPMLYGPTAGIASFLAYCSGDMLRTRELLAAMDDVGGDWMVPAVSSTVAASVAFLDRRYDDAAAHYAETLTHYDEPTSPKLLNLWLGANSLWYAGRRSEAHTQYQQLRREADSVGDAYNVSLALRFEAMVGAQIGDIDRSWRLVERSLAMARELGDDASIGQAEVAAAVVAYEADALPDAERHALDAIEATLRPYDLFTQRAAPPIAAAAALDRGDAETAAVAMGWYLNYLDQTGQPPGVATAELAAAVETKTREALGRSEFARTAATGAAMRLRELHDRLRH